MNRTVIGVGLALSLPLVGVLYANLGNDPHVVSSPLLGKPAPEFALRSVGDDATLRLSELRGSVVVLNFWATWCVPCYQEHEVLLRGSRRWGAQVRFLGVVYQDEPERVRRFGAERGEAYPSLMDADGRTAIAYGVYGVPETFFIGPDGTIVDKFVGPLTPDALERSVKRAHDAVAGAP